MYLGKTAAAALALLGVGPAWSYDTEVQSFDVYYSSHGSGAVQELYQYSGPLNLVKVKIDWVGSVYYDGFNSNPPQDYTYLQTYHGYVNVFTYMSNFSSYGPSASLSYSGSAPCTSSECHVSISGGESTDGDVNFFVGTETFIMDSSSDITPTFTPYDESEYSLRTTGTVTYYLAAAPEPASWVMMLSGFGAIGAAMRKRGKAAVCFT